MSSPTNKTTVHLAVVALNTKAEKLGLDRRFEFEAGSSANGVHHVLVEVQPQLAHPTRTQIGRTLAEALKYVNAMHHAFAAIEADRAIRAAEAQSYRR